MFSQHFCVYWNHVFSVCFTLVVNGLICNFENALRICSKDSCKVRFSSEYCKFSSASTSGINIKLTLSFLSFPSPDKLLLYLKLKLKKHLSLLTYVRKRLVRVLFGNRTENARFLHQELGSIYFLDLHNFEAPFLRVRVYYE